MRKLTSVIAVLLLMLLLSACSRSGQAPAFPEGSTKLKVATSFYPMYEFTRAVAGDKADIVNLVPAGVEPHDWEPTSGHIRTLNKADLFIYNGLDMEHWVEKALKSNDNKSLTAVATAEGYQLLKAAEHEEDGHGKKGEEEEWDPHVWLSPLGAIHQVGVIRDALVKVDPANKTAYEANAAAYIGELKALDQEFRSFLPSCGKKKFFASHAAFSYLAHEYGLEQHALLGLTPEAEPKPKTMANLVALAKANGIQYIFFETLVSDKVTQVLAKEIGAKTLVLNPLEGLTDSEVAAGKTYLSVMRDNLSNLRIALDCPR